MENVIKESAHALKDDWEMTVALRIKRFGVVRAMKTAQRVYV